VEIGYSVALYGGCISTKPALEERDIALAAIPGIIL